jgi:hypothetical protein
MRKKYDAVKTLKDHRAKYGTVYRLPDGSSVRLKDGEVAGFLKSHGLKLWTPSLQGDSVENEQVGIK